jgi:hypothetical protein
MEVHMATYRTRNGIRGASPRHAAYPHEMLKALKRAKQALPPGTQITAQVLSEKAREFLAVTGNQFLFYIRNGMETQDREDLGLPPRRKSNCA